MKHDTQIDQLIERVFHNTNSLIAGATDIWSNETREKMFAASVALQENGRELQNLLTKEAQS